MLSLLLSFSISLVLQNCNIYTNDGCQTCTNHYRDRHCGWCASTNQCVDVGNETQCNMSDLYYNHNAQCGEPIPQPSPTPWPHYEADPTFCYKMTGDYCKKCVSTNVSMSCGWCHTTKECIMGDALGPFFLECKEWSFTEDNKCLKKASDSTILGLRIGLGLFIGIVILACIFGCYKVIKSPPSEDLDQTYQIIGNSQ